MKAPDFRRYLTKSGSIKGASGLMEANKWKMVPALMQMVYEVHQGKKSWMPPSQLFDWIDLLKVKLGKEALDSVMTGNVEFFDELAHAFKTNFAPQKKGRARQAWLEFKHYSGKKFIGAELVDEMARLGDETMSERELGRLRKKTGRKLKNSRS